jgi:uncharacterized repeat protein (TIGR03803 family)
MHRFTALFVVPTLSLIGRRRCSQVNEIPARGGLLMRDKRVFIGLRTLAIFAVTLSMTNTWAAVHWNEKVLHNFNGSDGSASQAGLIFDAAGNLYGTTAAGGTDDGGTVFELSPTVNGDWSETVLHSFNLNGSDGLIPYAGLLFDTAGNLYGTTLLGGTYSAGTVFELSPMPGGGWTETVLYSFGNGTDGAYPLFYGSLILDAAGNLYGTTVSGGTHNCQNNGGCGTVFQLSPTVGGGWTETVLYNFGNGTDGYSPETGLVLDTAGNLYGTTTYGGANNGCAVAQYEGCGTVFELTPAGGGGWTETVVHDFGSGTDGFTPIAGLTFDTAGNLYGTTLQGGTYNLGTAFQLSPVGQGWSETVLYNFNTLVPNGGTLVFDAAGSLYGTSSGGSTAYKLTPTVGGGWMETVLYTWGSQDGSVANLVFDAAGNLYGTTEYGGNPQCDDPILGCGTVFELMPIYPCTRCSHAGLR